MDALLSFTVTFIFITIGRYAIYYLNKKKSKKSKRKKDYTICLEMKYLIKKFKITSSVVDTNKMAIIISLVDAFIIATTLTLMMIISTNFIIQVPIGFLIALVLIYFSYEILGRILKKRGFDKNE